MDRGTRRRPRRAADRGISAIRRNRNRGGARSECRHGRRPRCARYQAQRIGALSPEVVARAILTPGSSIAERSPFDPTGARHAQPKRDIPTLSVDEAMTTILERTAAAAALLVL